MNMTETGTPDIEGTKYRQLERRILLPFLLFLTVLLVYGAVLKYPFIQDDWYIFNSIRSLGAGGFLHHTVFPAENFFYRPAAQPYFLFVYKLFFPDPTGMHIIALILHAINSIIVVQIVAKLLQNDFVAWCSGFLYAGAVTIHMDSLLWMVGMYDILGSSFFFLSILLVISGKFKLSFATFALALLTKESTIILLPILFLIQDLQFSKSNSLPRSFRLSFSVLWMHIAALLIYVGVRLNYFAALPVDTDNPYAMGFNVRTVLENIVLALRWYGEGISPYFIAGEGMVIASGLFVLLVVFTRVAKLSSGMVLLLWGWILLGLLPVLFLEKHFFRYYLTYSLVPVLLIVVVGMQNILAALFRKKNMNGILAIAIGGIAISSAFYFSDLNSRGHAIPTMDGSNNLIRKGAVSTMVHDFLMQRHPEVSHGTAFLFNWVPTIAFGKDVGPQFWYDDTSLQVFEIQQVKYDSRGVYYSGSNDEAAKRNYLDPAKIIFFDFHGERFREVEVREFFWPVSR
jgi:hypothetical protein